MSNELLLESAKVTPMSDVYALGGTILSVCFPVMSFFLRLNMRELDWCKGHDREEPFPSDAYGCANRDGNSPP